MRKHIKQHTSLGSPTPWIVTRLCDERTGEIKLGIDFPTNHQGIGFVVLDFDLAEQPAKVRTKLRKHGAVLVRRRVLR